MPEQQPLTEQESLRIITDMLQTVKRDYRETGISSLLWGTVIGVCGIVSFLSIQFHFELPFDIWLLTIAALIGQAYIFYVEKKKRKIKTYDGVSMGAVWMVFGISIFLLSFYQNAAVSATEVLLENDHTEWLTKNLNDGTTKHLQPFVISVTSLYLLVYAMPTMITGIIRKFKPMVIGAVITYVLFFISIYTSFKIDMLLTSIAGIVCWLIPGLILYRRYKKGIGC